MNILDISPLLSSLVGFLLGLFILFRKTGLGKDIKLRYSLAALVFIITFIAFDYYIFTIQGGGNFIWGSVFFNHLTGPLFYYFIAKFTGTNLRTKKWITFVIVYTLVRYSFFIPYFQFDSVEQAMLDLASKESNLIYYTTIEAAMIGLVNTFFMIAAFQLFNNVPQYAILTKNQEIHFKWIKLVLIVLIVLIFTTLVNSLIAISDMENHMIYIKNETLLYTIFFFVLIFSLMQYPIFAFSGNYEDLPEEKEESSKKYQKSSLSDSAQLFHRIETLIQKEELFLKQEFKLNMLVDELEESLHHISQAINENARMSFPDYVNQFRVEKAKEKLLQPNPDTIFAIAIDTGFNSKANFYHAFKKFTHTTPTAFRKANLAVQA